MSVAAEIQIACSSKDVPSESDIEDWIRETLDQTERSNVELTLRIVDEDEIKSLNRTYRHTDYPTDVLAFPIDPLQEMDVDLLGDVIICADIVNQRAEELNVASRAHWARIVAHGVLHLCGYDHKKQAEATEMESLEGAVLTRLGFRYPELTT